MTGGVAFDGAAANHLERALGFVLNGDEIFVERHEVIDGYEPENLAEVTPVVDAGIYAHSPVYYTLTRISLAGEEDHEVIDLEVQEVVGFKGKAEGGRDFSHQTMGKIVDTAFLELAENGQNIEVTSNGSVSDHLLTLLVLV